MKAITAILGVIVGLVLIAAVVVGGYKLNWWLAKDTTVRSALIQDHAPSAQRGYRTAAEESIKAVLDPASSPAIKSYNITVACENIGNLDSTYRNAAIDTFTITYCQGRINP